MVVIVIVRDKGPEPWTHVLIIKSRVEIAPFLLFLGQMVSFSLSSLHVSQIPGHRGNGETREARSKRHLKRP